MANRNDLINTVVPGLGTPLDQYIPAGIPGNLNTVIYGVNGDSVNAQAEMALFKQTYTSCGTPTVNPNVSDVPVTFARRNTSSVGAFLAGYYHQTFLPLGIDVIDLPLDAATLTQERQVTHNYDMTDLSWLADYPDPYDFLNIFFIPGSVFNWGAYNNPTIVQELNAAALISDPSQRKAAYELVHQHLRDDAASLAWLSFDEALGASSRLNRNCIGPAIAIVYRELCLQ